MLEDIYATLQDLGFTLEEADSYGLCALYLQGRTAVAVWPPSGLHPVRVVAEAQGRRLYSGPSFAEALEALATFEGEEALGPIAP